MSEQSTPTTDVARELMGCAGAWEPEARVLGNVRAADIVRLCESYLGREEPELRCLECETTVGVGESGLCYSCGHDYDDSRVEDIRT